MLATPAPCRISHNFLTDWWDDTGLRRKYWTPGRMMTCGFGFRHTGRTPSTDLRIISPVLSFFSIKKRRSGEHLDNLPQCVWESAGEANTDGGHYVRLLSRGDGDAQVSLRPDLVHFMQALVTDAPVNLELGWTVSENTVAAVMREQGLAARRKNKRRSTTRPGKGRWHAVDLVRRDFPAQKINTKWYGDGTEIKTGEGKLYL